MKKIIPITFITLALVSVSCRKERTCECTSTETTVTSGLTPGTETNVYSYKVSMEKQKKKEFKWMTDCVSTKEQHTNNYGPNTDVVTTERKCELK